MADTPASVFSFETDDEIYDQILADFNSVNVPGLPDGAVFNSRPGSALHALLFPLVQQRQRMLDAGEFLLSLGFLRYTQGPYLDAKAIEYGVSRNLAVEATVVLTFVGDIGTVIPINTEVTSEGTDTDNAISFVTTDQGTIDVSGTVNIPAKATLPGTVGNVAIGALNLLTAGITGVSSVSNEVNATGGVDEEDDEGLRARALVRARTLPQGGNAETYQAIALSDPEVGIVTIVDQFAGAGSVAIIVGGTTTPYVSPTAINRLQEQIDPTIKNLAFFESEPWVGGTEIITVPLEGAASRALSPNASATDSMTYTVPLNLSKWDSFYDEIWIQIQLLTAGANLSNVKVIFFSPGGVGVGKAEGTLSGALISGWGNIDVGARLILTRGDFVVTNGTGVFSWGNIGGITISVTSTGAGASTLYFDGLRIRRRYGGFLTGQATLGVQAVVLSARQILVDVDATITLETGLTLSDVQVEIENAIRDFMEDLEPGVTIRLSDIANAIHDTTGVVDYIPEFLEINGINSNLTLENTQRPVFGTLTLTVI